MRKTMLCFAFVLLMHAESVAQKRSGKPASDGEAVGYSGGINRFVRLFEHRLSNDSSQIFQQPSSAYFLRLVLGKRGGLLAVTELSGLEGRFVEWMISIVKTTGANWQNRTQREQVVIVPVVLLWDTASTRQDRLSDAPTSKASPTLEPCYLLRPVYIKRYKSH